MLRQLVRPAPALPAPAPDAVVADSGLDMAYATLMSARCALARFLAGHREPPRHRAA